MIKYKLFKQGEFKVQIPTPHIEAKQLGIIAETVIMPGDPLRAKLIAETYLTDVTQFNHVRNMYGYTGYYNGKKVSIMGSGMGIPSMGIYSYELYAFYGVENIIRIGSAGSYDPSLKLYDVVLVQDVWSESTYAKTLNGSNSPILQPAVELNNKINATAAKHNLPLTEARVHCSDVFYRARFEDFKDIRNEHNCLCVEMESTALFANAQHLNKKAACLLTISDSLVTHESASSEERQKSFTKMMKIALESI